MTFLKQYIDVVLLISILLFISPALYATDKAGQLELQSNIEQKHEEKNKEPFFFNKGYNAAYNFIGNHEYLLVPLSGLMAGARVCGAWCALAGGVSGAIDEISIYLGFTDKRYLTWGVFGAATGHAISPSLTSDLAGVAFGILLPTGVLNEHKEIVAPVAAALAGKVIDGIPGMLSGAAIGALDEELLKGEITDSHYLTFAAIGEAFSNILNPKLGPAISNFAGAIFSVMAINYGQEMVDGFLSPAKTAKELYTTYSKFIPAQQLNAHIEKHVVALVGSQFLTQLLSSKNAMYQQTLTNNFEHLNDVGNSAWGNFKKQSLYFAIFLFPYVIGQTVSNSIDSYFEKNLYFALEDKVISELYSGETSLRLSYDKNSTVLVDNLKGDIATIVGSGAGLVANSISTTIGGAYGVGVIVVSSPNIFIYSILYEKAQAFVSQYLASQRRAYSEKIRDLDSKLISNTKHDTENIRTITERDGIDNTRGKIQGITEDLRGYEGIQKLWSIANNIWWSISGSADFMLKYYLIGNEINKGRIKFEDRAQIQTASWQLSGLLSLASRKAMDDSYIQESLDRVVILEGKIHGNSTQLDQINRVTQDGNQLILKGLEVGIGDRLLVTIEELKLDMGKVYAITGESGCGKTSLLSKIKGIKENGVFGKGTIYYPKINGRESKIIMLGQQDYFPLDATLQEIIAYPDKISTDPIINKQNKDAMTLLLKEVGLYAFSHINNNEKDIKTNEQSEDKEGGKDNNDKNSKDSLSLDSKKNWYTYFSGGEKKKVMIVSAILKKPEILMLDEIFNGLDAKSISNIQQMLKKYLPATLILIVDHNAKDNNYRYFYEGELLFTNKSIILKLR